MLLPTCLALCLMLAAALWRAAAVHARFRRASGVALARHGELQRAARLAASDLRDAALRLHARAGAAAAGGGPATPADDRAALVALAQSCRFIAEDLAAACGPRAAPALAEELVDLGACAAEAISGVAAAIAPGRRDFRIAPAPPGALVWADRRAVRQALARVLGEAVLSTAERDTVALALRRTREGGVCLVVADEGSGSAGAAFSPAAHEGDSRGLAGRLALPRALMEAHGGRLEVIAAPGAGTRASLVFPPWRLRGGAAGFARHLACATLAAEDGGNDGWTADGS